MQGLHPAWLALIGTGFTFLCTAMGAAMVFLFRKGGKGKSTAHFLRICRRRHDCRFRMVPADPFD